MRSFKRLIVFSLFVAFSVAAFSQSFKTTPNGVKYRYIKVNKKAYQAQEGDVLVCTCKITMGDSVLVEITEPQRLFMVTAPQFKGDLPEGLKLLHTGDHAVICISADSVQKMGAILPPYFVPGKGMRLCYEINVADIVTKETIALEEAAYRESLARAAEEENAVISQYVREHNIDATPDERGLYVIVKKQGTGERVANGRTVKIDYVGKLLNGKVFDSSIESVAEENGLYNPQRTYMPLQYVVGQVSLIEGWERGVMDMPAGTELMLIIPSSLGYGPRGAGADIPPNSPLIFELNIIEVRVEE